TIDQVATERHGSDNERLLHGRDVAHGSKGAYLPDVPARARPAWTRHEPPQIRPAGRAAATDDKIAQLSVESCRDRHAPSGRPAVTHARALPRSPGRRGRSDFWGRRRPASQRARRESAGASRPAFADRRSPPAARYRRIAPAD